MAINSTEPRPRHRPEIRVAVLLAAILGGGAALRLADLGGKSFWLDEAFSVSLVRAPWPTFAYQLTTREANMAFYYLLLRAWLPLGSDETTVRLLSAIAAIATIGVIYAIGARLRGPRVGLLAALLLAMDPLHLSVAQEARSYALVILLLSCSTWAFVRAVDTDHTSPPPARHGGPARSATAGWWALYVVTSTLAVYTHFYAGLALLAQWCSLAARPPGIRWPPLLASGVAIAVLLIPLARFFAAGPHDNIAWIGPALAVGLPKVLHDVFDRVPIGALAAYVLLIAVLIGLAVRAARSATSRRDRWASILLISWVAVPPAIAVLVTLAIKPVLDPRYLVVCVPGFALTAAAVIDRLRAPRWRTAALATVLTIDGVADGAYFTRYYKEDWRDATAAVLTASRPGDVVQFYAPYVRRAFDYYVSRAAQPARPPRGLYPSAGYADFLHDTTRPLSLGDALDSAQLASRAWLVLSHANTDPACARTLDAALRSAFPRVSNHTFVGIEVRLYARATDAVSNANRAPGSALGREPAGQALAPTPKVVPVIRSLLARDCPQN